MKSLPEKSNEPTKFSKQSKKILNEYLYNNDLMNSDDNMIISNNISTDELINPDTPLLKNRNQNNIDHSDIQILSNKESSGVYASDLKILSNSNHNLNNECLEKDELINQDTLRQIHDNKNDEGQIETYDNSPIKIDNDIINLNQNRSSIENSNILINANKKNQIKTIKPLNKSVDFNNLENIENNKNDENDDFIINNQINKENRNEINTKINNAQTDNENLGNFYKNNKDNYSNDKDRNDQDNETISTDINDTEDIVLNKFQNQQSIKIHQINDNNRIIKELEMDFIKIKSDINNSCDMRNNNSISRNTRIKDNNLEKDIESANKLLTKKFRPKTAKILDDKTINENNNKNKIDRVSLINPSSNKKLNINKQTSSLTNFDKMSYHEKHNKENNNKEDKIIYNENQKNNLIVNETKIKQNSIPKSLNRNKYSDINNSTNREQKKTVKNLKSDHSNDRKLNNSWTLTDVSFKKPNLNNPSKTIKSKPLAKINAEQNEKLINKIKSNEEFKQNYEKKQKVSSDEQKNQSKTFTWKFTHESLNSKSFDHDKKYPKLNNTSYIFPNNKNLKLNKEIKLEKSKSSIDNNFENDIIKDKLKSLLQDQEKEYQ